MRAKQKTSRASAPSRTSTGFVLGADPPQTRSETGTAWTSPRDAAGAAGVLTKGVSAMGHRVMETHNLHGKTAARHLVPRSVRRSRKRALRMAAKSPQMAAAFPKPVRPVRERKQVALSAAPSVDNAQLLPGAARRSWKQVLGIAAKTPETPTAPAPAQPEHKIPVEAPQAVPTPARPVRKEVVRVAAKVQKPAKPPKRAKPPQPGTPTPQPETEVKVDEARPTSTDRLEDGVVEWGIKREEEKDSKS